MPVVPVGQNNSQCVVTQVLCRGVLWRADFQSRQGDLPHIISILVVCECVPSRALREHLLSLSLHYSCDCVQPPAIDSAAMSGDPTGVLMASRVSCGRDLQHLVLAPCCVQGICILSEPTGWQDPTLVCCISALMCPGDGHKEPCAWHGLVRPGKTRACIASV